MNEAELFEAVKRAQKFVRHRKFMEADLIFRQLLKITPRFDWGHYLYGCMKLLRGDYEAGWTHFENRFGIPGLRDLPCACMPGPRWDGGPAPDKTVFIHSEQGLGDSIMCARWLPQVADRVGRVVCGVQPALASLMRTIDPRVQVFVEGGPAPPYDLHLPIFSLPPVMGCRPDTIPAPPYMSARADLVEKWRNRFAGERRLKVGLAWRGNAANNVDYMRSIPLVRMVPIIANEEVRIVGLQAGEGDAEIAGLPEILRFDNLGPELIDSPEGMMDLAACMSALDLVVSVDTAIVHLAGALGLPAWVLLYDTPDWRWLLDRGDSPWYPSLRLFRQPHWGAWDPPIVRVAEALAALVVARKAEGG